MIQGGRVFARGAGPAAVVLRCQIRAVPRALCTLLTRRESVADFKAAAVAVVRWQPQVTQVTAEVTAHARFCVDVTATL